MKLKGHRGNNEIFDFYILFLLTPNCEIHAVDSVNRAVSQNIISHPKHLKTHHFNFKFNLQF